MSQVEMASYAHLFGFVEEFIAPLMARRSGDFAIVNREGFDALSQFVSEEIKHMNLFRRVRERADENLGIQCRLLDNSQEVAQFVHSKSDAAILLLTACIEWFTQAHYLESIRDHNDLDPLCKRIFRYHWAEEAGHARIDHLETIREFAGLSQAGKNQAAEELVELVLAVDGLLATQSSRDIENFTALTGVRPEGEERKALAAAVHRAKRHTFIVSGVTHPEFQRLFTEVFDEAQQKKVVDGLAPVLQD